jgi:hypothetical protein
MNLSALDLLYLVLSLAVISLVIFLNLVLYNIWLMVKAMRHSLQSVHSATQSVINFKTNLKRMFLSKIKSVLSHLNN